MPSGGTTTQTTNNEPWKAAQPYLKEILGSASGIYGSGSTFVPPDQRQIQGLEQSADLANAGNPLADKAVQNASGVLSSGGMNDQQRQVTDALSPYATGDYLGGGNPYLDQIIGRNTDTISDAVRSEMAGLGRTGSGAHQGILADRIGNMASQLRYNDYGQQVGNQFRAADQIFGANQAGQQQALQTSALAPQINNMRFSDADRLSQIGSQYRGFGQEEANAPWNDLSKYASIISGTSQPFGTSTTTGTTSGGSNPLQSILGGLLLGSSFIPRSPTGATGMPMNLLSDKRAKTDIRKVGKTDGGTPVYTYRYKHQGAGGPMQMGVMAQELGKRQPDAVTEYDGILGVDYSQVK